MHSYIFQSMYNDVSKHVETHCKDVNWNDLEKGLVQLLAFASVVLNFHVSTP